MKIYENSNLPNVHNISAIKRQRILSLVSAKIQLEELKQNFSFCNKESDNSLYMIDFPKKLDDSLTTSSIVFKECNESPVFCCFIDDTKYWIYSIKDRYYYNTARIFSYHIRSVLVSYNNNIIAYVYNCPSVKKKIPVPINLAAKRARSYFDLFRR